MVQMLNNSTNTEHRTVACHAEARGICRSRSTYMRKIEIFQPAIYSLTQKQLSLTGI